MGKPKPNAFYYYMQDRRKEFEKQGKKYSLNQMPNLVTDDWRNLSKERKQHYDEMCKRMKSANRLTNDGIPVELSELDRMKKIEHDMDMKREIEDYLGDLLTDSKIVNELFFIINVNEYCFHASRERYIPAEIGISCFNLSRGVINTYHVILDPQNLPLGYKGTAMKFSEETHRLPIPPDAIGEKNHEIVLNDIISFLSQGSFDGNEIAVMFALGDDNRSDNKNFGKVVSVMSDLAVEHGLMENKFKIYPLTYLFFYLNKLIGDSSTFPSTSFVLSEIEKDIYAYENGIACEPHKNNEAINWCALSKSVRYAYSFLEHFCPYFGVPLKPGCHVPENAKIKDYVSNFDTMSTSSSRFSRSTSIKSEPQSFDTYYADDDNVSTNDDASTIHGTYVEDDSDFD